MTDKGFDWDHNIATHLLSCRDTWMSFFLQLYPGILWGLVLVIPPLELESMMRKLYHRALSILDVNRNITTEWRMLPEMYQGLGLPNFTVHAFAKKVFFLQCNWGFTGGHCNLMQFAFEAFLIKIGLYGDVFQEAFSDFGILATSGTWFKNFWELGNYLDIKVSLHASYHIQPVREGDRSLRREEFAHAGFAHRELESLNTVRKYKHLLHSTSTCYTCPILCAVMVKLLIATSYKRARSRVKSWLSSILAYCCRLQSVGSCHPCHLIFNLFLA